MINDVIIKKIRQNQLQSLLERLYIWFFRVFLGWDDNRFLFGNFRSGDNGHLWCDQIVGRNSRFLLFRLFNIIVSGRAVIRSFSRLFQTFLQLLGRLFQVYKSLRHGHRSPRSIFVNSSWTLSVFSFFFFFLIGGGGAEIRSEAWTFVVAKLVNRSWILPGRQPWVSESSFDCRLSFSSSISSNCFFSCMTFI